MTAPDKLKQMRSAQQIRAEVAALKNLADLLSMSRIVLAQARARRDHTRATIEATTEQPEETP